MQRLSGLRVRFALAMGAFGIALGVLMGGVINWRLEEGLRSAAHVQLQAIAHELADYLNQSLGSRAREIALVADLVGHTAAADALPLRHAIDLVRQRQPAYAWIGITDPAGRVRVATAGLLEGVDVRARPWFVGGRQGSYLGDPHRAGANPARPELTESALAADVEDVVAKMRALRELGVSFALADFGTGFSSLSYLNRMPIDLLKIDQSFVREIAGPGSDVAIVRAVIALGRGLGLAVIAEGVETETQRATLAELGCHRYQGYLFGRPVALAQFIELTATARMATVDPTSS